MNAKGVYTPEQINDYSTSAWNKFNPDESMTVDKEACKNMCEMATNELGSIGDGQKHDEELFEKAYAEVDKLGFGQILYAMLVAMVTYIVTNKTV